MDQKIDCEFFAQIHLRINGKSACFLDYFRNLFPFLEQKRKLIIDEIFVRFKHLLNSKHDENS